MNLAPPPGAAGTRFNLSEWALHHRPLVLFLLVVCALAGALAYGKLGQSEDPPFTFKVMVIRTQWSGATAREVELQVTDRIERKLQEVPFIDWVRSYSKPGESLVFFAMKDSTPVSAVPETFYQVRKKVGDMRSTLPSGIQGPFFNDEFGDTYTNIYAITGDGFGYRELKEFGDRIRNELLRVPGVAKVDFIGEQEEKVFIELSNSKLATLGVEPAQIFQTLSAQNAIAAAGVFDTRDRPHLPASDRGVRVARRDPGHCHTRQQPRLPAGRHRQRRAGLRRAAPAADALPRPRGAGHRRDDGKGRRRHRARAGAGRGGRARRERAAGRRRDRNRGEHAARGPALGQPVRALARRGGADRARRVAR